MKDKNNQSKRNYLKDCKWHKSCERRIKVIMLTMNKRPDLTKRYVWLGYFGNMKCFGQDDVN